MRKKDKVVPISNIEELVEAFNHNADILAKELKKQKKKNNFMIGLTMLAFFDIFCIRAFGVELKKRIEKLENESEGA